MKRPRRSWLVIAASEAHATFDDLAEARDYANTHPGAEAAHILCLPHWPAGLWRHGIETLDTQPAHHPDTHPEPPTSGISPVIRAAHRHHTHTNRRCRRADIEVYTYPDTTHYHCQHCGDRIL